MEQFWMIFGSAIGTVVTALLSWLTAVGIKFLNSKLKDQKLTTEDKKMVSLASKLFSIVMNSVQAVAQEFVSTLKKNGTFNEIAQKEAKERALAIIRSELTPELKTYIAENFGDIESYLRNQIEAMLYQLKNN